MLFNFILLKTKNTAWSLKHRCSCHGDVRCGKSLSEGISAIMLLSAPHDLPISKSSFHPQGISATLLVSVPAGLPISKSSFHPQGISATLLLSAPVSLPISKSS
ncbi:hypothetical protein, partial [Oceanobacillus oncorhynchi]|uniref:hypothetical protein n=1 Tax=Oceanobacillus oncorhynchi TaxID=545501 RepID=UPI00186727D4